VFLRLNGWPIPIAVGSASQTTEIFDPYGSEDGRSIPSSRLPPRETFIGRTPPLEYDDAGTLRGMLAGASHVVSADINAWSSSGVGPTVAASGNWSLGVRPSGSFPGAGHGRGFLTVTTSIGWAFALPPTWTVMFWRDVTTTPAHVVVRSDGRVWTDGVETGTAPEVDVSDGTLTLSAGVYDDIVAMPFLASADFIAAFYRSTVGAGLSMRLSFDEVLDDDFQRVLPPVVFAPVVLRPGIVGNGALFTGPGSALWYPAHAAHTAFGASALSFDCWYRKDTHGGPQYLVSKTSNGFFAYVDSSAWPDVQTVTAGVYTASGIATTTAEIPRQALGEWQHIAFSWSVATGTVVLYANGVRLVPVSSTPYAAAAANDAAQSLVVGNNPLGTAGFDGIVDEIRVALGFEVSLLEARERYLAGLTGAPGPLPRPFAPAPVIDATGEVLGGRLVPMVGALPPASVVQHGSRRGNGWRNDSRYVDLDLRERSSRPLARATSDDARFDVRLSPASIAPSGALRARSAGFGVLTAVGPQTWERGLWGASRVQLFGGLGGDGWVVPPEVAASLAGLSSLTVLAWIRVSTTGAVLGLNIAAADPKVQLSVAGGRPALTFKPATGEPALTLNDLSGPTLLDGDWHLISFSVDVENQTVRQQQDGAGIEGGATFTTATPAWSTTTIDATSHATQHRIAATGASGLPFDGAIARIQILPHTLTPMAHHALWRYGTRGFA